MATILAEPRRPSEHWQLRLEEWVDAVGQFVSEATSWAQKQGWGTRTDSKTVTEESLGTYEVPVLLIQTLQGRVLLDPVARNIVGAEGRIDFCVFPSYDSEMIIRESGNWRVYDSRRTANSARDWSEAVFLAATAELLERK